MTHGLALCAGGGGFEVGIGFLLDDYRAVCYVEREPYAVATLYARMVGGVLAPAPIWDDLVTFDGRRWRGRVHLVVAGWPCSPWSRAGRGDGERDPRWLWPSVARVVREVFEDGVGICCFENVPDLAARGGLRRVLEDLAGLGFYVCWGVFGASTVGAPHIRDRLFLVAARDRRDPRLGALADAGLARLPDAQQSVEPSPAQRGIAPRAATPEPRRASVAARGARSYFPPPPDDARGWADVAARRPDRWPAFEIGEPAPALGGVRRVADGLADGLVDRAARIRMLGNGVVPLQAAVAVCTLAARLRDDASGELEPAGSAILRG